MTVFTSDIDLFQMVYLRTDQQQAPRIVTGMTFSAGDTVQYRLVCGTEESFHFRAEINVEVDKGILLNINIPVE